MYDRISKIHRLRCGGENLTIRIKLCKIASLISQPNLQPLIWRHALCFPKALLRVDMSSFRSVRQVCSQSDFVTHVIPNCLSNVTVVKNPYVLSPFTLTSTFTNNRLISKCHGQTYCYMVCNAYTDRNICGSGLILH